MRKDIIDKIICGAVVGGMILSTVGVVNTFAITDSNRKDINSTLSGYLSTVPKGTSIEFYDSGDLSGDTISRRKGNVIIERIFGTLQDAKGNGKTDDGYYMNYSDVEGAEPGAYVVTYCVYNPETNYEDDILYRYDTVIEREQEADVVLTKDGTQLYCADGEVYEVGYTDLQTGDEVVIHLDTKGTPDKTDDSVEKIEQR